MTRRPRHAPDHQNQSRLKGSDVLCGLGLRPREISIGEVFRIFESSVPFAECFSGEDNTCPLTGNCRLRGFIGRAVEAFYHELDRVTLDDLVRGNCGLEAILQLAPQRPLPCSTTSLRETAS